MRLHLRLSLFTSKFYFYFFFFLNNLSFISSVSSFQVFFRHGSLILFLFLPLLSSLFSYFFFFLAIFLPCQNSRLTRAFSTRRFPNHALHSVSLLLLFPILLSHLFSLNYSIFPFLTLPLLFRTPFLSHTFSHSFFFLSNTRLIHLSLFTSAFIITSETEVRYSK